MATLYEKTVDAISKIETTKGPSLFRFVDTVRTALIAISNSLTQSGHRELHSDILSWDDLQFAPDAFNPQAVS